MVWVGPQLTLNPDYVGHGGIEIFSKIFHKRFSFFIYLLFLWKNKQGKIEKRLVIRRKIHPFAFKGFIMEENFSFPWSKDSVKKGHSFSRKNLINNGKNKHKRSQFVA